ncbi:MAG: hypothetical protein RMK73_07405 [Geminicoccaceae bacterium]|nr:hypothetical protein [Geminicoccaceae bacterium]MDW8341290.1 hypothetical protein [Geminicoccaceae bacterium]
MTASARSWPASMSASPSIGEPVNIVIPPATESSSAGAPPREGIHLMRSVSIPRLAKSPAMAMCQEPP